MEAQEGVPVSRFGARDEPGWLVALCTAVVIVACWPIRPRPTLYGLDNSWETALEIGQRLRLSYGSELLYSLGPLGFLTTRRLVADVGLASWAFQIAIFVVLAGALVSFLRRVVAAPVAAVLAVAIIHAFGPPGSVIQFVTVLIVLTVWWSIDRVLRPPASARLTTTALAGAIGAAALLLKLDTGVISVALPATAIAFTAWTSGRWRSLLTHAAVYAAAAVVTLPALWLATGNELADLPTWLGRMPAMASGYAAARGLARGRFITLFELGGVVVTTAAALLMVAMSARRAADDGRRNGLRTIGLALIVVATAVLAFRQGFTRYDDYHVRQYFTVVALVPLAFLGSVKAKWVALAVVAGLVLYLPGQGERQLSPRVLADAVSSVPDTLEVFVSGSARSTLYDDQSAGFRAHDPVPQRLVGRIGNATVHVVPFHTAVLLAYPTMRWRPLPVFQDHMATTPELDDVNVDAIDGDDRPTFVLRKSNAVVDGNLPRFTPPAQNLALLCRYRVVDEASVTADAATGRPAATWQLLRATANRCGAPDSASERSATLGEVVDVPAGPRGTITLARFSGIADSPLDRLRAGLLRGKPMYIGNGEADGWFRFAASTQGSWHVLDAPACLRDALDATGGPFDSIAVADTPGGAGSATYRVEFAFAPVRCG